MPNYSSEEYFARQARCQGYRARSVFKLIGIDQKFHLTHRGQIILDLGAAPGSFTQYLSQRVGPRGRVFAVDLQPLKSFKKENLTLIQGDISQPRLLDSIIKNTSLDLITADLAPKTSGIKSLDQSASIELNENVLKICQQFLKPGGDLVTKIFQGPDFQKLVNKFKKYFLRINLYRPPAVRPSSQEIYLIARQFKKSV